MQSRLHGRRRNAQLFLHGRAGQIFNVTQAVDFLIESAATGALPDGIAPSSGSRPVASPSAGSSFTISFPSCSSIDNCNSGSSASRFFSCQQTRLAICASQGWNGAVIVQLIKVPVSLEQRFYQNVFGVFAVAANANHVPVHRVFVLVGKFLKSFHSTILSPIHRPREAAVRRRTFRRPPSCGPSEQRLERFHGSNPSSSAMGQISVRPANVNPSPAKPAR